jgi:predicted kinase
VIESTATRLIVIRGNSGSGKSSLARLIRAQRPRGVAIVGQDQVRREILRVHDGEGNPSIGLIDVMVRHLLSTGRSVVLEGILRGDFYGDLVRRLVADHAGVSSCWFYHLSFEQTVARHVTKPNAHDWTIDEMRSWWQGVDLIDGLDEHPLGADLSLDQALDRVFADVGWARAPGD